MEASVVPKKVALEVAVTLYAAVNFLFQVCFFLLQWIVMYKWFKWGTTKKHI